MRNNPPGTVVELVDSLAEVKEKLLSNSALESTNGSIGRTNLLSGFDIYYYNITRGIDQDEQSNMFASVLHRSQALVDYSLKSRQFISSIGKQFIRDGMVSLSFHVAKW